MRRKYLLLLLIPLAVALSGCHKKHFAPPPEPNAPSNLTATAVSYKQIHLSWQDNSDDEDYFRVLCPTMWGIQHQTIATLPPNTTSFDHRKLQPMTEYEYFVCVHRGEEHTCSGRAYATTPCPVTASTSGYCWDLETLVKISGSIESNASEACRADITVFAYDYSSWDLLGSAKETFELEAFEWKHFSIEVEMPGGKVWIHSDVEITDVEIDY